MGKPDVTFTEYSWPSASMSTLQRADTAAWLQIYKVWPPASRCSIRVFNSCLTVVRICSHLLTDDESKAAVAKEHTEQCTQWLAV